MSFIQWVYEVLVGPKSFMSDIVGSCLVIGVVFGIGFISLIIKDLGEVLKKDNNK